MYPKRLIEVDLPIKRISSHARREKTIRHGHISTLHIWWARRPLAACRAVICASLWPDPADPNCPQSFRDRALKQISAFAKATQSNQDLSTICDNGAWQRYMRLAHGTDIDTTNMKGQIRLRAYLLDFIADFAACEAATNQWFLDTARSLTQAAHEALGGEKGTRPLVIDPFAGGGAIPLEALRIGADAFASDLNPVPVLLNTLVLKYIPKYGRELGEEVRKWGRWVKDRAEEELRSFYPAREKGETPIAYLWARTIRCEGPACGAEVPLMRTRWLARKPKRSVAVRLVPNTKKKRVEFEIDTDPDPKEAEQGTVKRGSATCPCCGYTTPVTSVRSQLKARKGGATDARLYAVVTTRSTEQGRFYRPPDQQDLQAASAAAEELETRKASDSGGVPTVPDELTPRGGGSGAGRAFSQRHYGMEQFCDLFTPRQLLALVTLGRWVREAGRRASSERGEEFGEAVQAGLALCVDKVADLGNAFCPWEPVAECPRNLFARQAIPMGWNFGEGVPIGESSGGFAVMVDRFAYVLEAIGSDWAVGQVARASATHHPLPDDSVHALVTDPPYYDAVPYSDLSDFFYVWLKRNLPKSLAKDFSESLTPKADECIVDEVKAKDRAYFERTMRDAMAEARRVLIPSGIGTVVFAHKSTAGWEAQLQAMVDAGWTITGSWPIDTEMESRFRARDSAALGSSVHLVCRPRENANGELVQDYIGDWRDVLSELPKRTHEWMSRLASEGVVGADAIFACLGPALEVFSRYSRVEKASGEQVMLKEYLTYVWGAVAQEALTQIFKEADATGFEEDARLTAMWLWTLNAGASNDGRAGDSEDDSEAASDDEEEAASNKSKSSGYMLEFDAARKIAQGLGAHLEDLNGVVEIRGDQARLLSVPERTRRLFGKDEADAPKVARKKKEKQMKLFSLEEVESEEGGWGDKSVPKLGDTTLDRVHQSMILFAAGRGEALRRFLTEDGAGRDQRFWKLANALSALYPQGTDEKRWVDGVLARKKGLGL